MDKKINKRTHLHLGIDHNIKLDKVCEITKETQSELVRRLIDNELYRLTDKPELIIHGNPAIAEKQLTYIMKQLSAIIKILERLQASAYHIHYDLLRFLFVTTRTLFNGFKMEKKEVDTVINQSDNLTFKYLERVLTTIGAGLETTIKIITAKPKPPEGQSPPPETQ